MIGSIRKHIKTGGAKLILWVTLLGIASGSFFTVVRFSRRFGSVDALATVNGYDISVMEYRRKLLSITQFIQEIRKVYGSQADVILSLWGLKDRPEQAVLDELIQKKAIQAEANNISSHIDREYVSSKLRDPLFIREFLADIVPPQALAGGSLNVEMLRYNLARQGMTEQDFDEAAREAVQYSLLDKLIKGALYIPNSALKDLFVRQDSKKKYAIIGVKKEKYLKKVRAEKISDKDIENYFTAHKEDYRVPERRNGRLWTFAYEAPVTDKELHSYYDQHRKNYIDKPEEWVIERIVLKATPQDMIKKRREAQELMKAVKENPQQFEGLAKKHSESPERGAPITLTKEKMEGSISQALLGLTKGGISPVIETEDGFALVKLIEKKLATYKPIEKVKGDIKKTVARQKFITDFNANAQRIISQANEMPELFKRFVEEKKAQVSTIENMTLKENVQAEKLFDLQKKGDKAFYAEGDKGYIIELTDTQKSYVPELSAVKDKVMKDIYDDKAHKLIEADLQKARSLIPKGVEAAAKAIGATSEITDWVDPRKPATYKKLEDKKITMSTVSPLAVVHATALGFTDDGGYVIELHEIEPFDQAAFERKKNELRTYMIQKELPILEKSFIDYLRSKAQVTINEDLLHRSSARI